MSPSATTIVLNYVCPGLGAVMASAMFAAPVGDLKRALVNGDMGDLNALPWVFMTGNCLGWVAYGYYIRDAFVIAGNVPGLVLSIWLNMGAIKIQYYNRLTERKEEESKPSTVLQQQEEEKWDADVANDEDAQEDELDLTTPRDVQGNFLVAAPHERMFFQMLIAWTLVLVWVGWILPPLHPQYTIGIIVNINLVFFYGAPLQTLWEVMRSGYSDSIHRPTMVMNWTNTSFWLAYAIAQSNLVIGVPNFIGLLLGIAQGIVCLVYPRRGPSHDADMEPIPLDEPLAGDDAAAPAGVLGHLEGDGPQQEQQEESDTHTEMKKAGGDIRLRREGTVKQPHWTMV